MQERALVSIIIPCYDQARFLGEAIESALNQNCTHREIIHLCKGKRSVGSV